MKAGKEQEGRFLLLLAWPLMMKHLCNRVKIAEGVYNNMDHMDKNF